MWRKPSLTGFPSGLPATKVLCVTLFAVSLVSAVTQRKFGFGVTQLVYNAQAVMQGQIWRLMTYPFIESSTFSLLFSVLVLWFFGNALESQWGTRYFVRFYAASAIGAGVLAIPLTYLLNLLMPFTDISIAEGPSAAINAMLVSMAITTPDANVLFGFLLPMRAKTLIYVLLVIQVVSGIQSGAASMSVMLSGMLMGYLLTTGYWRPSRLWQRLRAMRVKRRSHLYVVFPPKKDQTLH
jgi:membrane associated rhomboid family serine protease